MPKCYSEQERTYIRSRLKEEAAKCLAQYGIRRTTVDELVKRAKIPKGTFYLFYQSKELLLFEVLLEQHDTIEKKLFQAVRSIDPKADPAEQLTDILLGFYIMATEMPVLKLLNSGEIELLARKLPQAVLAEHFEHDNSMIERLFDGVPLKPGTDPEVISAAFHSLYFASLHKEEIGAKNYEQAMRILIHGLVTQFL